MVLYTSILDSLPVEAAKSLKIDKVTGIKIKQYDGSYANYFEYNADKELLLTTLSSLPFALNVVVADTTCYRLDSKELALIRQQIASSEYNAATAFWNTDFTNVEVYECLKPPYRHTVQISKNSNRIFHRIEFVG